MRQPAPAPAGTVAFSRAYPARPSQIRAVRSDLRELLDGCPVADEVVLCASELAANAAIHSNSGKHGGTLTIRAEIREGEYVRVEVDDSGGPWPEPPTDPDRPHGLDIIQTLTAAWGVIETTTGRTVWAHLDWPACR